MITLRRTMVWVAAAILCLGFGTVATAEYIYDFDSGRVVAGLLTTSGTAGQDNWVNSMNIPLGRNAMVTDYSGPPPVYTAGIEGLAVTRGGDDAFDSRVNDANWGYSIPSGTAFSVEFNLRASGHTYRNAFFALAVDDVAAGAGIHNFNEIGFQFGYGWGKWYLRSANFGDSLKSSTGPTIGEVYRVFLDVDPTFNSGDGQGSLYVQRLTGDNPDPDLVAVADLQGFNLGLLGMYDPDPSHWDGMFIRLGFGSIMDHLMITVGGTGDPIPGDANLDHIVNDADASILAAHWQQSGAEIGWGDGDFDGNNIVNDADASILAAHWQQTSEGAAPVPEPATVVLLAVCALALPIVWQRRKRIV